MFVLLVGLGGHPRIATAPNGIAATGRLLDTDAYVRTLRAEELRRSGDWFATDISRLNAPYGLSMHWTRPLDALILVPALAALVFAVAMRLGAAGRVRRLLLGAGLAGAAVAILLALYPHALSGPRAGADAGSAALFLPMVAEMQPLAPTREGLRDLLLWAGIAAAPLLVLPVAFLPWMRDERRRAAWLVLALPFAAALATTLAHRRCIVDLAAVACTPARGPSGSLPASKPACCGFRRSPPRSPWRSARHISPCSSRARLMGTGSHSTPATRECSRAGSPRCGRTGLGARPRRRIPSS